jgi:hypothetical protein
MLNYHNLFEIELKKLINEEIKRIEENLSNGLSVVDFADYRHQVGKIIALRTVLERCDEVQSILNKK